MGLKLGGATKEELAGQQFAPVPNGDYVFFVKDLEPHEKETDEGTKHSLKVTLKLSPTYDDQPFKGFQRPVYLSVESGKRGPLFEFLQAVGYKSEDLSNPDFELEPAELLNKQLQARVTTKGVYRAPDEPKDSPGRPNYDVNRFRPVGFNEATAGAAASAAPAKRKGF